MIKPQHRRAVAKEEWQCHGGDYTVKCSIVPLSERSSETLGLARPLGFRVGQCELWSFCLVSESVDSQLIAEYRLGQALFLWC